MNKINIKTSIIFTNYDLKFIKLITLLSRVPRLVLSTVYDSVA